MVKLIIGDKGSGKTKSMVDLANRMEKEKDGNIVFIIKDDRLTHDLNYNIRMIVMDEYRYVSNIERYIGFIYGIVSTNHDIQVIFIDSILKHIDISPDELSGLLEELEIVAKDSDLEFIVSLSADINDVDESLKKYVVIEH